VSPVAPERPVDRGKGWVEAAEAARALLASAEALERALERGEEDWSQPLAARARCFAAFRAAADGTLTPEVRALVERVVAIDRRALARAGERLAAVSAELGQTRRSRDALRSLDAERRPARFFSERA